MLFRRKGIVWTFDKMNLETQLFLRMESQRVELQAREDARQRVQVLFQFLSDMDKGAKSFMTK